MAGTLAHYRVLDKLGAGGMGEVYRAYDEKLCRDVAIKILPGDSFRDDTARARLLREARAAAALNHPSICTIHEVGEEHGQAYIAMEYIDGVPLRDRARRQPVPWREVVRYGILIADALAHAHARQIVHRDLKSANVMVTAEGRIKVLDFGLAKRLSDSDQTAAQEQTRATLTQPGVIVGTLAYMSPEQARGEPADARSDIWALGVVLYELASGQLPFDAPSSVELSAKILKDAPTPLPPTVPAALRAAIEHCLEKSRERRYQTAGEARAALESIQSGTAAPLQSLRYQVSRRSVFAAVAATAAIAAIVAVLNLDAIRTRSTATLPQVESIAVLPLANLSGDPAQEYFADGMTEVLSTDLARLGGLKRVTARGSVMRYKGTVKPLDEIARELKVDALLTGSVQRAGDRVSITAQLLEPSTGNQIWSNRYERDLRDVLAIRNEIVTAIVAGIKSQLSPDQRRRLASAQAVNPEAFEAYLKGRFHWLRQTRQDYDLAERYYQLAIEKDPEYGLAHAGLSGVWMMRGELGLVAPSEAFAKADVLMNKAMELSEDEALAELHMMKGNHLQSTQWDSAGAEREYRRAIELDPNLANAHFFLAALLSEHKRWQEWDTHIRLALDLDPLNDFNRSYYGWHLNTRGRYDEAIPIFQQLLPAGPNKAANHLGLWGAYHRKGMWNDAMTSAREYFLATADPDVAAVLQPAADAAAYRARMRAAGEVMVANAAKRHVPALRIARMFAHAGDNQTALDWLEKAYANREAAMMRLAVFWDWLDLHGEPRYQSLIQRLKLPS
jgi:serine/threonine-protein kinase